jgi:hypothetical protein
MTRPDSTVEYDACDYDLTPCREPKHFANFKSSAQAAA